MTLLFRLDKGLRALAISQFLKDLSGSMMSVLNYFRMGPIRRGRYSHLHGPLDIALLIIYPKKYRAVGITPPAAARPDALDAAARLDLQAVRLADHRGLPSEKYPKLAQKLGQLQPFLAVIPQECMGQLASFGPT